VNDLAQDGDTVFTGNPIPWDGVKNGNGAVGFTAAQGSVDLTGYVPAPSVGGAPQTTFFTSQYIGKVKWIPEHSTFQAGVAYRAIITLEPAAGFVFSSDLKASHSGAASVGVTHEYDLSVYVPPPMRGDDPQRQGTNKWVDYSTDKWTIQVWWYRHDAGVRGDDGPWYGTTETLTGDEYGAFIILTAKTGYPFDEKIDFKYPTYDDNNGKNPLRGYYKLDTLPDNIDTKYVKWWWQNGGDHRDPPPAYDRAPKALANYPSGSSGYPVSISKSNSFEGGVLKYKLRTDERLVMVGFNTQDAIPTFVSPPSLPPGSHDSGVRLVTLGFNTLGIPSNLDSGGATFSEAVAMIRAAKQTEADYLSLQLNGRTAAGTGTEVESDKSVAAVSFSIADSPPAVVVDGGNRVVEGTDLNPPFITVGTGVTLTLRNITLKSATNSSVIRVDAGGALILEEGVVIRGHTTTHSEVGGAVMVAGGTLTMKGGEISGNFANGNGGGVYVAGAIPDAPPGTDPSKEPEVFAVPSGAFTMQGGTISGNTATNGSGGAVYVGGPHVIRGQTGVSGATFFMQGGTLSGNTANTGSGGGVYVGGPAVGVPGGTFVKSNGAIYANTAAGRGSAVYVQGGRYRDDTVTGFLDSGKSINAGGWDYPVIPHTYYKTDGTGGVLEAGQVDWYAFTAPGGGAPLSVEKISGPVKVSAYRAYGAPIPLDAAPPAFAAG
jgi:hypothetical protein